MLDEISAAVLFLVRLIEKSENFNQEQLQDFKTRLSELLVERFKNHWFPETPFRGQGYRCIRVNERDRRDVTLERAAIACGLKYEDLKLPVELTLWVDPNEVCCRFGEHRGSYCTLASFNGKENLVNVELLEKMGTVENESRKEVIPFGVREKSAVPPTTVSVSVSVPPPPSPTLPLSPALPIRRPRSRGSGNIVGRHLPKGPGVGFHAAPPTLQNWYSLMPPAVPLPPPHHPHQHPHPRNKNLTNRAHHGRWSGTTHSHSLYNWQSHKPALKV